jgi:hypothetical protein
MAAGMMRYRPVLAVLALFRAGRVLAPLAGASALLLAIASRLLSYRFFRSSLEDFHSLPWRLEIERAGRRLAVVIGG